MSGDYKPSYQSSPGRKRISTMPTKDQASIYKYSTPSTLNLYNNTTNGTNNNINNSNNHFNLFNDSSKYYNNQSNINNNNHKTSYTQQQQQKSSSSYSINSNNSIEYDNDDNDVEVDQDINYSNTTSSSNRYNNNNNNNNNSSYVDFSTDDNPTTTKRLIKPPQPLYNHLDNQINQQQQQQQHRNQNSNTTTSSSTTSTTTTTTLRRNNNQQQHNNNIISKYITEPWKNFYYGDKQSSLWIFEKSPNGTTTISLTIKQTIWIFFFSMLFLAGILGLFATKYHGINIYLPFYNSSSSYLNNNTSSSSNTNNNNNNNNNSPILNIEQLKPFLDEYIKKNELISSNNKLIELFELKINQLLKNNKNENLEIKEEIQTIKLNNMNENKVEQLINKMINQVNNNENNKNELKELLESSIKELKKEANNIKLEANKLIAEFEKSIESLSSNSILQLKKTQDEISSNSITELKKTSDEISKNSKLIIENNEIEFNKLYNKFELKLKEFGEGLKNGINSNTIGLLESSKSTFIKELEGKVMIESKKLSNQYTEINQQFNKIQQFIESNPSIKSIQSTIQSLDSIKLMIDDMFEIYSADYIAKADYALLLSGASIEYNSLYYPISKTYPPIKSENYNGAKAGTFNEYYQLATNWIFPSPKSNPPETILDPLVNTGSCWGFYGGNGTVVIKLAKKIVITDVTLQHIHPNISHHINSAPKDFQVYGLVNKTDIGTLLGSFTYQININRHLQNFKVTPPPTPTVEEQQDNQQDNQQKEFTHVALRILNNHGYRYTCVYRFRVHGYQIDHPEEEQLMVQTTNIIDEQYQEHQEQEQQQQQQQQQQDSQL